MGEVLGNARHLQEDDKFKDSSYEGVSIKKIEIFSKNFWEEEKR